MNVCWNFILIQFQFLGKFSVSIMIDFIFPNVIIACIHYAFRKKSGSFYLCFILFAKHFLFQLKQPWGSVDYAMIFVSTWIVESKKRKISSLGLFTRECLHIIRRNERKVRMWFQLVFQGWVRSVLWWCSVFYGCVERQSSIDVFSNAIQQTSGCVFVVLYLILLFGNLNVYIRDAVFCIPRSSLKRDDIPTSDTIFKVWVWPLVLNV